MLNVVLADMSKVSSIEIPHCLISEFGNDVKSVQLHGFADASKVAYAANIYIRVETSESVISNLVTAKTKVAPLKVKSIPRLELLSEVILSKLITTVSESLQETIPVDSVMCWLNSQVALWCVYGDAKEFKQFVQNRAKKIRSLLNKELWMYCPSELNPSDIGSRGAKYSDLLNNELWWNGPSFLVQSPEFWPNILSCPENTDSIPADEAKSEMKSAKSETSTVVTSVCTITKKFESLIICERYSSLNKLIHITAYVLKFVRILKSRLCGNKAELSVEL